MNHVPLKRHVIQTQQVGQTGVLFTFHVSGLGTVLAPAEPRKNGVWLSKCVQQEAKEGQTTVTRRTSITIAELLNPPLP